MTLAEDKSAAEANLQAETKRAVANEIKARLDQRIKEEEGEDDDTRKEQLKRVLQMDPNLVAMVIQEKEDALLNFVSYNSKVDKDHLHRLPHDLMLYALSTDRELRAVFLDSYVEIDSEIDKHGEQEHLVKLFAMDEYTYKSKKVKLLWVGFIVNDPEEKDCVDITGFHGTTLACALQYSRHPLTAMFRGPRHVPFHKLAIDECYYGTWNKSNT